MRTTTSERIHAERVSAAVDELMGDPEARLAHLDDFAAALGIASTWTS